MENSTLVQDVPGLPGRYGLFMISPILDTIITSWYLILPAAFLIYCSVDTVLTSRIINTRKSFPVATSLATAPRFILNFIFAGQAGSLVQRAYNKYKTSGFQLIRNDGSVVVLPLNLLEELASLPERVANPQEALEHDLLGRFTGLKLILENRLHHSIVQRKLTPRLSVLAPRMEKAVGESFSQFFPDCEEWTEFQPYQVLGRISARVAADAIVGPVFCDNPAWLDLSFYYTENLFRTIVILRMFPEWMQKLVYPLVPSYWECQKMFKRAKQLLGPRMQELVAGSDSGAWAPKDDNADDLNILSWLCHMAKGRDRDPPTIAHVMVLVTLASVHTTLLRMVNVLYDVTAAGPGLRDDLMDEVASVVGDKGGWTPAVYDELRRLDSVMRESQRMSPPSTLGMKRLFKESHTFSDGTFIPAGTYVSLPVHAIENDPAYTARPEVFDGLRSFHAREGRERMGELDSSAAKEFLFTTPTRTALGFGYGKSACPGRFFASYVIKMVMVKMLSEYEFKFLPGTERPTNLMLHEFLFTWPWQKLLVRRRKGASCPF